MDAESIREIATILEGLSGDAKDTLIWYLVATSGVDLAKCFISCGVVVTIAWFIKGMVLHAIECLSESKELRDAAGVSFPWSPSELDRAKNCLREHYPEYGGD